MPRRREGVAELAAIISDDNHALPLAMKQALQVILDQLAALQQQVGNLDGGIRAQHRASDVSRRLETIPGIGLIGATAIASTIADPSAFKTGRDFAAWIGLFPGSIQLAARKSLGYLKAGRPLSPATTRHRRNGCHPARPEAPAKASMDHEPLGQKAAKLVAVAVANKMARIAWAVMAKGGNISSAGACRSRLKEVLAKGMRGGDSAE